MPASKLHSSPSQVYYASVTSTVRDGPCWNLLTSWPLTRWR